ncbi:MAG: iron ABC transporter permease [bacterium]|nr:iron ABC transporter permease [bacterium]
MTERRPFSYRLCSAAIAAVFVAIVLLPVAAALTRSIWTDGGVTLGAYAKVLAEARQWGLLRKSLLIACGTALVATALGALTGIAMERGRVYVPRLMAALIATAFLVPPYIWTVAWLDLLGPQGMVARVWGALSGASEPPDPFSIPGVIAVLSLAYFPIVTLTTVATLRRFDERLVEAASIATGRTRAFVGVVLPVVAPGILTGTLFVFVLSLVGMGVPSLLQVNTYPVELYASTSCNDIPAATAQSLPLMACGGLALLVWALYVRPKGAWLKTSAKAAQLTRGPARRIVATVWCAAVVAVAVVLPVSALVQRAMPLTSFVEVWTTAREEIVISLGVAAASATALTVLGAATAFFARNSRGLARLYSIALLAFLISGPMVAMGLIAVWNRHGPLGYVYDSIAILVLACAARYAFFAHHGATTAFKAIHPRLDEAAAVAGASWWRHALGIRLPLAGPALVGVWGLAFVFSLREVDAAVLVTPPGTPPLSVRLFSLMHYGPDRFVAALSLLTVTLVLAVSGVSLWLYTRWRRVLDVDG